MELKGKSSRIQSSLGSKLVSSSDSVVSTLLIARVTDINYKENYVIFVPITTNSTSRPATRGTNQALLPSEFAGRNGFGRSYGVINPIHVGDVVLIGLLESDAAKPIVISRYPDTKIATELTNQVAEHYEPADFTTYADANRMTVVYPDQGYNIHDGRGNLTLKFSGNTFMLVRPDVPNVSHSTDDGQSPISAKDIPGNKDGLGQDRNSLVQNAPEVIYGHRGNINKDGTKDNHAYYVYIGQDGDYRVSMMQDDQDWRTYFEETPDGQIRLRRQEDSKIFGAGSKSSEFLIDNNGYVTIRSQSTGLVLRPDGIYNLDGTKFTVDTDLSGVWDAINETKNGVEENKTQIKINADGIATKVSTDELPAAINDQLKPYDDSLNALKDSYTDVQKTIDNMASDGVISGADKKATRTIWLQIQTEYPATIAQAEANGVDHTSLDAAYTTLKSYLTPLLAASGDTVVDPTEWDRNFSNYYNTSYNVNTAIVAALRKLAQDGYNKAVQAAGDAGNALTQVSQATSEDYLTGSDKATLGHVWIQIQNQYPNDVNSANAVSVDHSALDSAYNDLSSYISSNNIFADNSTIAIDGSALADKIKAYFSQESAVLKQVADKNIQTLAQYGEDINHQATAIKETSTKIALSAENIQKQGDSLSVMQGQLNIMSNQISGGVSETDVTGIVNDSLSGTGLGSTNQFVISTATKGQYMNGNNGTSASSPNGIISDYISVKAGSVYTGKVYGATGTTKLSVAWYDSSKNFINGTEVSGTGDFTNSGTSPSNASYAKVSTDNYNFNTLFISGDAPDTWAPSYIDAKSNATDANILLKSLTNTQASMASSINANANKSKANVSNIDNMFVAGNLGSTDIGTLKAILADSGTDNASDNSLATQYGVDVSALNNYYSQLQTDISGILSQDEGTTVDVDSYKAKLSAYYNSRDTFLKAVKGKLDGQVSSAQESLANANNTVQEVITNKYANFAVTVNGISTKVGEVSEKADNASEAASTAQSSADDAKNRAISAASAAATAQASATTANSAASAAASAASAAQASANATQSSLDALTNDGNISPIEKQTLAKEYATIKSNKTVDLAQASKYTVDTTAYTNAEQAVETLVEPILADMTTNTAVDRDKYKSTFATYYNERTNLLNAIADVAKNAASAASSAASVAQGTANSAASAASAAQSDLNNFKTTTTQKFSEIDQTADGIKQSVSAVTTTANNAASAAATAQSNLDNLSIGARNYLADTGTPWKTQGSGGTNLTSGNKWLFTFGAIKQAPFKDGEYVTLSFDYTSVGTGAYGTILAQFNSTPWGGFNGADTMKDNGHVVRTVQWQSGWATSGTANGIQIRMDNVAITRTVTVYNMQFELGNKATDYKAAPEDIANAVQKAKSAADDAATKAVAAQTSLDALTNDGNISPIEKQTLAKEYATIKSNKGVDLSQASKYAVDATAYTNAEQAVETLVDPILADMTTNTSVDRDKYKSTFATYYTARTNLLNSIADVAKNAASAAASAASVAQGTANSAASAASAAQSSATDAKNRAISAASAAATAQAGADTANSAASAAASAASAAQSSANTAQSSANAAQTSLDALTNDGNISSIEKQTLSKEYATIKSNKTIDLAQASKYAVDATAYTSAESAVETLVSPILADMTANTAVDRDKYKSTFASYYNERTNLLNKVADVAKNAASAAASAASAAQGTANSAASAASAAQSDLNSFKTTTTQKFSEIDQTADGIKQSVTAVTTTANNASDKINNLQVGGTNLALGTANSVSATGSNISNQSIPTYYFVEPLSNLVTQVGSPITLSFDYTITGSLSGTTRLQYNSTPWGGGLNTIPMVSAGHFSQTVLAVSTYIGSTATGFSLRLDNFSGTITLSNLKLELGSIATDWSPAPADNASASDLAATNQTVKTVQTQTANNWSILAQGIGGTSAGISVDGNGTVTISGNKLVIGSDFIAGDITGKTITGSAFVNTFSHAQIDGAKSSGNLNISNAQLSIIGNIEDNNGNANGQYYNTSIGPNGLYNNITTPDNKGLMSQVALQRGALQLETLIGDPNATTKKYIQSEYTSADNVTFYYNNTTAYSNIDFSWAYIYYIRRGNLVTVSFNLNAIANQYQYLRLADMRPGYTPQLKNNIVAACPSFSYPGELTTMYSSTDTTGHPSNPVGWYGIITHPAGGYAGSVTYLTQDDYPTGDSFYA